MSNGKTILVTGATSGIGYRVCMDLLDTGAKIFAVGRNQDQLAALQKRNPDSVQTLAFDLTQFSKYSETFSTAPNLDGVVCSAGIADSNPLRFFSIEKYQRIVDINQTAPIALIAELARNRKLNTGASIVLLASILGTRIGRPGGAAYAGTKAALTGFAKVMALELANKSIRVNCVSPGMVNTELAQNQSEVSDDARKVDLQRYPLGKRYAEATEVSSTIQFLLSDNSSFITGENIVVDGGFCTQ